jgi:hypothetical protein
MENSDKPPAWLRPYMGDRWQPRTLAQWAEVLRKEGLIP